MYEIIITNNKEEKILFLDGHNSHVSIEVIDLASKNNITLICLIAHSTHALQPLDVGVFKTAKTVWKEVVNNYYKETGFKTIEKSTFPSLLKKVYKTAFLPQHAVAGFFKCGL